MSKQPVDEKYNQICKKLGFIPSEYHPKVADYEDDSRVNPFSVLEMEELLYLFDNGYMKANTRTTQKAQRVEILEGLFETLDKLWNASEDRRYKGEHPGCVRVLDEIEEQFKKMTDDEIKDVLCELPKEQIEQLFSVFEDTIDRLWKSICNVCERKETCDINIKGGDSTLFIKGA